MTDGQLPAAKAAREDKSADVHGEESDDEARSLEVSQFFRPSQPPSE